MKFTLRLILLSILVLGCFSAPVWADSITVQNESFAVTNPLSTSCGQGCAFNVGAIPDWTVTGTGGSWHTTSAFPSLASGIVAYSNGGTISQTLTGTSLLANTTYTLSVQVGHRLDGFASNYTIALYAGNTLLNSFTGSNANIALGTFASEGLTFTTGAKVASGELHIVLTSDGAQTDFAHVQLTDTAATPEPASLLLLGSGLLAVGGFLRRRLLGV